MNENDWLKDLKVGDKVIVESYVTGWGRDREITEVVKITPKDFIDVAVSNGRTQRFRPNGYELASTSGWSSKDKLIQATPENIYAIEFRIKINNIKETFKKTKLSDDQWLKIGEILEDTKC